MLFKHKEEVTLKPNAKQTQIKAKQIKANRTSCTSPTINAMRP